MGRLKWNKYEVNPKPIDKGYQGQIYEGYDPFSNKKVAIKQFNKVKHAHRELSLMKSYGIHPMLPEYYDYFTRKDKGHIVMEFLDGEPLINKQKIYRESLSIQIILSVLEAFNHLHTKGFLHCDIGPQNIMIQGDNPESVKVIDFANGVKKGKDGVFKGRKYRKKNPYGPPELRESKWVLDDSTDLYGVATTALFLLTNNHPNYDEKRKTHPIALHNKELQRVFQKAMHPDRNKRYSSAKELFKALQPFV